MALSGSRNPEDQPKLCDRCGRKVLSKEPAVFYYDLTKEKRHRTRHVLCETE